MSEVEDCLKRISNSHKGVIGYVIVNKDGQVIRRHPAMEPAVADQYSNLIAALSAKARNTVRDLDPQNDLTFLRIRSRRHEIMVAPDKEFLLIVIQNPNADTA
eukprot:gnl/Spiro4/10219_TR5432_c0_g1_i1.p1 gnl/Spiro4/10219_TR5432_c0_g1~~gnl/Spiro4/10219_TR5432_c0_g1_i1.p1  ORF type:complete len:103 (+),score=8.93 gnl/Spiro4/10219_TR5432_c0_g1_i1:44-352(+)